jgi:hypothetical protein
MFKVAVVNLLIEKIASVNKKLRMVEDECSKFSVAPTSNGVYNILVGYRKALQDTLDEVRSINEGNRSN